MIISYSLSSSAISTGSSSSESKTAFSSLETSNADFCEVQETSPMQSIRAKSNGFISFFFIILKYKKSHLNFQVALLNIVKLVFLLPKKTAQHSAKTTFFLTTAIQYHTGQIIDDATVSITIQKGLDQGLLLSSGFVASHQST